MKLQLVVCLSLISSSATARADDPPEREYANSRSVIDESAVVVVSDSEVAPIFEDLMGRPPSDREIRKYRDLAYTNHWDRERFREEFRQSDECRAISPERAVESAYRELLHRDPTSRELRRSIQRVSQEDWTPGRIRREILASDEYREISINRAIEHAYREVLERRPDISGREHYRQLMMRGKISEEDLYRQLRNTTEYRVDIPNAKILRAWKAVLGREPDLAGLESYRRTVLDRHFSQEDIERDLRKSPEFGERADRLIRAIYRELVGRDPDGKVVEIYRKKMLERGWTEEQVRDEIRHSSEYKGKTRH